MVGLTEYTPNYKLTHLDRVRTGDILLFSNEPKKGSLIIMSSTRSNWVHVGIAVWSDSSPRRLLVFESTRGKKTQDELTGEMRRGVRLTDIVNVMNEFQVIHVRHLNVPRTPEFINTLNTFMQEWKDTNYVSFWKIPLIPFLCFEDEGVSCSELVARFLKAAGLFEARPTLNNYCLKNFLPSHYSPGGEFSSELTTLFANDNSPVVFHQGYLGMETVIFFCLFSLIALVAVLLLMTKNTPLKIQT
jgi:hypothetical protein